MCFPQAARLAQALRACLEDRGHVSHPINTHMQQFESLAESAQHCQRNWDHSRPVDRDTVTHLLRVAHLMPTKQNQPTLQCVAFVTRDIVQRIGQYAYNPNEHPRLSGLKTNPQTDAPVLLVWFRTRWHSRFRNPVPMEIGISSGAVALAAADLGMRTGFCVCVEKRDKLWHKRDRRLMKSIGYEPDDICLLMGVGYGHQDVAHNQTDWRTFTTYPKRAFDPVIV